MSNSHPWSRDPARDAAVRAAENAAAKERTTLPDHRELPERVARLEAVVTALQTNHDAAPTAIAPLEAAPLPATVTRGMGIGDTPRPAEADGMRTERVTLEIAPATVRRLEFDLTLNHAISSVESNGWRVRVVPSAEADAEIERLRRDRDEQQEFREHAESERDEARARVAELEGAATDTQPTRGGLTERDRKTLIAAAVCCEGNGERGTSEALEWILERDEARVAKLEADVTESHPAITATEETSQGGEVEKTLSELYRCFVSWTPDACFIGNVKSGDAANAIRAVLNRQQGGEAVAWGVRNVGDQTLVWSVRHNEETAKAAFPASEGWEHFPLFRAPPPLLTAEERAVLTKARDAYGDDNDDEECATAERVIDGLLARAGGST